MKINYVDAIVLIIIIYCCYKGYKKGLIVTAFNLIGFLAAIVCAKYLTTPVARYLNENTSIFDGAKSAIYKNISAADQNTLNLLKLVNANSVNLEKTIADLFVNATCFLVIFALAYILIKLARDLVNEIISKTPIKHLDKLGGMAIGFAKAVIIVFLLFAILTPILGLIPNNKFIMTGLNESYIAKYFYQYNLITPLLEKLTALKK